MRRSSVLAALLLATLVVVPSAAAQNPPETLGIHGTVLDPSGAPLAGARVTATPIDGGVPTSERRATGADRPVSVRTDERGQFALTLELRDYQLTIAAPGFVPFSERWTRATAAQDREFVLQVQGVQEAVNVTGAATLVAGATRIPTPVRDVPQSVSVVGADAIKDQLMMSIGDVVRYVPGITAHQGENNRDDLIIRGNRSSADFFLNGVRDDVQYYRDLYNVERLEALKGPNALVFGRGGGGGVVNRVLKEAGFEPLRAFTLQAGGYGHKRVTADLNHELKDDVALRLNGMFEDSEGFRRGVTLTRSGINPTLTLAPSGTTRIVFGYEYLRDRRVADRGITSVDGRPAPIDPRTFYGDPDRSHVHADVHLATAALEHRIGRFTIRNRTLVGNYDRFYQNFVPGAATPDRTHVSLSAYNNASQRTNVFNQFDVLSTWSTGALRHTLLVGSELGRQATDNFRNTGFFNNAATTIQVPFDDPETKLPVTFRQSATDADNHVEARVAALFAQHQIHFSERVLLLGGVRADRFALEYHNDRNGETLSRTDNLVSPRFGLVFKPRPNLSTYASYSVSYLPSSGDQFSSLTSITEQLEPEKFNNYELGAKWEGANRVALTAAVYRLDRINTRSIDPNDPSRILQTGEQRTNGLEVGISGRVGANWQLMGGYAFQDAWVTRATASARASAQVAQVPHHTISLWNNYQLHPRGSVGLGVIHRSDMFAGIDNTVSLPGYTRFDAAAYVSLTRQLRLQANVENLFDRPYFLNADSNTNISPGYPRTMRVALSARF
jgi:catecholate siderophore receptor